MGMETQLVLAVNIRSFPALVYTMGLVSVIVGFIARIVGHMSLVHFCWHLPVQGIVEQRDRFLVSLLSEVRKILEVMIIRMHEEDFSR